MLEILYKGGNCVMLSTKKSTVLIDGDLSVLGGTPVAAKGVVSIGTESRFISREGAIVAIDGPGEYEVADVAIRGVAAQRHIDSGSDKRTSTIYRVEIGEYRVAIVGNVSPELNENQLEEIGVVDIAVIPIGGNGYTLDATAASKIARQIDAKAVIPVHYADKNLKYEVAQDELEVFTKEFAQPVENVGDRYKLKGLPSLPASMTTVVVDRQ